MFGKDKNYIRKMVLYLIVTTFLIFAGGLLLSILWNFVVPTVFGLPALGLVEGIAIVGIVWLIRGVVRDQRL